MKFADYIKGVRRGRGAHDVELDAMRDPLLGDALDGFDAVPGDHIPAIDRLSQRIAESAMTGRAAARAKTQRLREARIRGWSVAAAALLLVGIVGGGYFIFRDGVPTDGAADDGANGARGALAYETTPDDLGRDAVIDAGRIVVVPNVRAEATDPATVELDELEMHDDAVQAETLSTPAAKSTSPADTVVTVAFRRYVLERQGGHVDVTGVTVTIAFEVSEKGRPQNISVLGQPSPEAIEAVVELLSKGPDWPTRPTQKLITIDL